MCVCTRSCTHSSQLLLLHADRRHLRNKVAQRNDFEPIYIRLTCRRSEARSKCFNSTKRKDIKRLIRAIYYSYDYTRSSPADVKQNKHSRVYHRKTQNFSNHLPFGNDANFGNYPDAADVKIQLKSQDYQDFYVLHSFKPCRRQANKRSSPADVKQNKLKRRIRAIYYWYYNTRSSPADVKQNKRSREYHRKI